MSSETVVRDARDAIEQIKQTLHALYRESPDSVYPAQAFRDLDFIRATIDELEARLADCSQALANDDGVFV